MEAENDAILDIPGKKDSTSNSIQLKGASSQAVAMLRKAVDNLIETTCLNPTTNLDYTHFLAFPIGLFFLKKNYIYVL